MIKYLFTLVVLLNCVASYAQKKTFDIVSYQAPAGWTPKEGNGYISYSKVDGSSWAQIAIYQHRSSEGDINKDFDKDWRELVAATSRGISAPEKTAPQTANGWTVMSGAGVWQFNGANVASMLTVYSNNKVCVSVLCNATAEPYLKEYQTLIGSLNLDAGSTAPTQTVTPQPSVANNNTSTNTNPTTPITGLWCDYILETRGYMNGMPQYTAGYFRKEYVFNTDGTYVYRVKNWATTVKDILFIYETGTYSISGNQLTITPKQGKGEWWAKQGGKTTEWGSLVKSSEYKVEQTTYAFEIKYFSGSQSYSLILKPGKSTAREGDINHQNEFNYTQRTLQTLIDNPPGFTVTSSTQTSATPSTSLIAGKIWEGTTLEKSGSGNSQFNTGGFFTNQYQFNTDGTYRFVNVNASSYTDTKSLKHETGTWSVNSNQLTITPLKGADEEWNKTGKTSNGNSDVTNRSINEAWGTKLKTSTRKLEQYTYTFSVEKNGDKTALVLQRNSTTVREGEGKTSYLNETSAAKSVKLPAGSN